jgi:peptidoglycan/xylan/chitin deacetylase (PgdA/CDA1 family)
MGASLFTRSAARARGKALWAGMLRISGILPMAKRWVRRHGVIVLTFHRVLSDGDLEYTSSLPGMLVREQTFEDFLKYAAGKYELMDLSREPDWTPGARPKLAVTFDDGWSDNASVAWPIAARHRVPMVIFIVPEKMGSALPFWPERAASVLEHSASSNRSDYIERTIEDLKGLPAAERNQRVGQLVAEFSEPQSTLGVDTTMTWDQVKELNRQGVGFGSHTSTHEILTTIPLAQAQEEIAGSRERIEQKLGKPCLLFAYPNGDCSDDVRKLVELAGYEFAFLDQTPGVWTRDCDPYLVPRVNVCEYHLVDAGGKFSPLIFDYAVVWNAAKGLMKQKWQSWLNSLTRRGDTDVRRKGKGEQTPSSPLSSY